MKSLAEPLEVFSARLSLPPEAVSRIRRGVEETHQSWAVVAVKLAMVDDGELAHVLSQHYDLPFLPTLSDVAGWRSVRAPPPAFLRSHWIVPLSDADALEAAVADPGDIATQRALQFAAAGREVRLHVAPVSEIEAALDRLQEEEGAALDAQLLGALAGEMSQADARALRDLAEQPPIIRVVDQIIAEAVLQRASDVHFEPLKDHLRIRVRVDGTLRELRRAPVNASAALSSRIKVLGGMDVANRRSPQDGRATIVVRGREIDLRIATAPSLLGETVAVRILDRDASRLDLDDLGLSAPSRTVIEQLVAKPQGLLLVTGPTGHGKTTTLYAIVRRLNDGARKILTIEDPIEYEVEGAVQVQVNEAAGVTFASALRAFLRHDPDVILVGEVRDKETAALAVQAALTGHLVLASMHTTDAASSIARLRDLGVEPFLIAATLSGVVAQRLVRTLCECTKSKPGAADRALGAAGGGCSRCSHTGYRGRAAIAEAFQMNDDLRRIVGSASPDLAATLAATGFRPLADDGADRVAAGETTWLEIRRVIS